MHENGVQRSPVHTTLPGPQEGQRFVRMLYPGPGQQVQGVALSRRVIMAETHWLDGHAHLCLGAELGCPHCNAGSRCRLYGYLDVAHYPTRRWRVMVLTAGAVKYSPSLQQCQGKLLGCRLTVRRMAGGRNAPVSCTVDTPPDGWQSPPPFDFLEALSRIWNVERRTLEALLSAADQL
jgi:hypothetical protein